MIRILESGILRGVYPEQSEWAQDDKWGDGMMAISDGKSTNAGSGSIFRDDSMKLEGRATLVY